MSVLGRLTASLALLCLAVPAAAQLRVEITKSQLDALPIAVVPLRWMGTGAAPYDVAEVVAADLQRSGRFEPMPRRNMLEFPSQLAEVDFDDWKLLDSDYLVVGQLQPDGADRFRIQFELFDVNTGERMLGYRLPAAGRALRAAAHRVADMVFEEITSVRGAFSTRIAYVAVLGEPPDQAHRLIIADADGENPSVIAESTDPLMSPSWSPDGQQLAYVSFEGRHSAVYTQRLSTGERTRISARVGVNGSPAWSPDGRRIALTLSKEDGNLDVHVLTQESNILSRITDHPAIDTEATWSPDGQWLYFTSDRSGGPQIYRIAADGSGSPRRLTFEGSYNARPRMSPDERYLAVVHQDRNGYRIALVDLDNAVTQVLTDGYLDESPSFSPNGITIIYATRDRGRGVLATVSSDGRVQQRLVSEGGDIREPVWSPFAD